MSTVPDAFLTFAKRGYLFNVNISVFIDNVDVD